LGSAIGALLHQRGVFPLHANAIEFCGQAVAFAGPSGAGKSTLAAHFQMRGRPVLSDDVCAINVDAAGQAHAAPGIPRIKLWSDALVALGRSSQGLERVFSEDDKFSLPLARAKPAGLVPLSRIYVLATSEAQPAIRRLTGAAAFEAVRSNLYRPEFSGPLGLTAQQFAVAAAISRSVEVFVAERRIGFELFEAEAARLEQHVLDDDPRSAVTTKGIG
jgi:hypothetical protein